PNYRIPLQRVACTKNQNSGFSPSITLHLAHVKRRMPVLLFDFLAFSFKAFVFGLSGRRPLLFGNCGSCWVIYQSL
ncbi:hypothetical protein BpHYR1_048981, partial [Brachionus plicatilis]